MEKTKLVQEARAGNKQSLVQLIMDNKNEYYRLAYVYTGNQEDALDALEDMIVLLYENIKKLKDDEAFSSWSKTILVNCCKQILRRRNKVILLDKIEEREYQEKYVDKETNIDIEKYLMRLNKNQQEVIKLKYFLDMDYASIAEILQVPLGTVKSRLSIGLGKLRELMGGDYR